MLDKLVSFCYGSWHETSMETDSTAAGIARPRCCAVPLEKVSVKCSKSRSRSARVCGMKARRQASGDVSAVAAQPMSARALLRGIAKERLANGVRYASVAGMKTRPNTDGAAAGVIQPAPSAVLSCGAASERSASGVRCAKVAGMNRRAGTQITRGGGALLPSLAV